MKTALNKSQIREISEITIGHYDRVAEDYWHGTRDHDVSQNYEAFLTAIESKTPYTLLDLGCGPGRDLTYFDSLGHKVIGLEGSKALVAIAQSHTNCEVLNQNFLEMDLPEDYFDGVFANASLFHVPSQELPGVLSDISKTLKSRGVLFSSNPRGNNEEGWGHDRYSCFFDFETWREYALMAGFSEIQYFYRPEGQPRHKQPWLATVWRNR